MNTLVQFEVTLVKIFVSWTIQTPVGKWILKHIFWPTVEPCLALLIVCLEYLVGPLLRNLPKPVRKTVFTILLFVSELMNQPFLVKPLGALVTLFLLTAVPLRYPAELAKAVHVFLTIGLEEHGIKEAKELSDQYFYPKALAKGPQGSSTFTTKHNIQIAQTVLLMSIMSYREDEEIKECLKRGMFPNTDYFGVHTGISETDMGVFVDQKKEWVVLCYRGTEFDTLRDVATSAFIEDPVCFSGNKLVRAQYFRQMKQSATAYRVNGRTVLEMVDDLAQNGAQIYCAGHSLGGGLATLLGAFIRDQLPSVDPIVITFGSPPVSGNEEFSTWYDQNITFSWRFTYGNEFAPMVPPVPFTSDVVLQHVPKLIEGTALHNSSPPTPSPEQVVERVKVLRKRGQLISLFFDHNPVLTLKALEKCEQNL